MTVRGIANRTSLPLIVAGLTAAPTVAQEAAGAASGATNYAHRPNTVLQTDDDSLVVHTAGTGETPVIWTWTA